MQNSVDHYFNSLDEPERGCLLFLRSYILNFSTGIEERRKNNTPFYYYNTKWFSFISYNPKNKEIYISFVNGFKIDHPKLVSEGRKKMKIFYVRADKNIDIKSLAEIMQSALKII